jgi:thiamine biosynthesis lipoprotein
MGAISSLWDFKHRTVPSQAVIDEALTHVNWQLLSLGEDEVGLWARLADPKAVLDLGGIAKGFIADELHQQLTSFGFDNAIINLGGNIMAFGSKPDERAWSIGIRNPENPNTVIHNLSLIRGSVVTSGPYERFFEFEGKRYHHILNSRTGHPVNTDLASATVISERSIDGDGYSTTLFALGSHEAFVFAETIPGIEALLVRKDGRLLRTSGLY